ncbi:MAG: hypothetical protein BWY70_01882 [Bacteroidetes bacterium ADurb.Bin408]|nr:MAG: hypothetical protein BWY70_01882 [Bacteroidetes bacterium ADurb.Bin408]
MKAGFRHFVQALCPETFAGCCRLRDNVLRGAKFILIQQGECVFIKIIIRIVKGYYQPGLSGIMFLKYLFKGNNKVMPVDV